MSRKNVSRYLTALLCCAGALGGLMARPVSKIAAAGSPQDLVNAAYAAMGGDKLKSITVRASLQQFDPGESYSVADSNKPDTGVSDLVQSRDLQRGLTRDEWVRPGWLRIGLVGMPLFSGRFRSSSLRRGHRSAETPRLSRGIDLFQI